MYSVLKYVFNVSIHEHFSVLNVFVVCIRNMAVFKLIALMCTHVYSYMFSTVHPRSQVLMKASNQHIEYWLQKKSSTKYNNHPHYFYKKTQFLWPTLIFYWKFIVVWKWMWPTLFHIIEIHVGCRKLLWPTMIELFSVPVGSPHSLTLQTTNFCSEHWQHLFIRPIWSLTCKTL